MPKRNWFWPATVLLLLTMGAAQVTSVLQETQTWDEGTHLAAGYSYLKTGVYKLNREHPPLFKLLCAAPLLALDPRLPLEDKSWRESDQVAFGDVFLYQNRVSPEEMLFCARAVTIALTLLLGLVVALWTRQKFGDAAAVAALFLFAFDPNLIAHGRYVTNDVMATLFIFLACITWARFVETKRRRDLVLAGVVLGLALVSKFSAVFLLPLLAVLYWLRRWQEGRGRLSVRHFAASAAVAGVIAVAIIALAYGPETIRCVQGPKLRRVINRATLVGTVLSEAGKRLGLPAHPYLVGLYDFSLHDQEGHNAYLMGMRSDRGWWYYFPVVFAVKTPVAILALLAVCLAISLVVLVRAGPRGWRLREIPFEWLVVVLPPLVYFALCMRSHVNIGIRHILPVYPFLFIALAATLGRKKWRTYVLAAFLVVLAAESTAIYPHYLAFFNTLVGGPGNGPKYLVDSNLDWGQDLKNLKTYLTEHGVKKLCISYFGRASMAYYKFQYMYLPETGELAERAQMDCVAAISATQLEGAYMGAEKFRWLRERQPMAKVGYSIYLYDFRRGAGSREPQ